MATIGVTQVKVYKVWVSWVVLVLCCVLCSVRGAWAQQDQGTITGVVQDKSGASIPDAQITLTNIDNGLVLSSKSDSSGIYNFSPIRIGRYTISATAPGFRMTTQENVQLSLQERLAW
jgi:uncharacterized protein YfaS (alpha-2-macroglobulin family)